MAEDGASPVPSSHTPRGDFLSMEEKKSMGFEQSMKVPQGISYPVDALVQLQSDPKSRELFNALPREIQLDILQHNTMAPEALRRFLEANSSHPAPGAALLGEDENSRTYLSTASDEVKGKIWQEKLSQGGES